MTAPVSQSTAKRRPTMRSLPRTTASVSTRAKRRGADQHGDELHCREPSGAARHRRIVATQLAYLEVRASASALQKLRLAASPVHQPLPAACCASAPHSTTCARGQRKPRRFAQKRVPRVEPRARAVDAALGLVDETCRTGGPMPSRCRRNCGRCSGRSRRGCTRWFDGEENQRSNHPSEPICSVWIQYWYRRFTTAATANTSAECPQSPSAGRNPAEQCARARLPQRRREVVSWLW